MENEEHIILLSFIFTQGCSWPRNSYYDFDGVWFSTSVEDGWRPGFLLIDVGVGPLICWTSLKIHISKGCLWQKQTSFSFLHRSNSYCEVQQQPCAFIRIFLYYCRLKLSMLHWLSMCFFTSTHFLLFLLPVSCLSLWYLKKVCNLHLLLRASLGANQVTLLQLRFFHFLLPWNLVFPLFF